MRVSKIKNKKYGNMGQFTNTKTLNLCKKAPIFVSCELPRGKYYKQSQNMLNQL